MKKGQVTLFIIIGIVIVSIFALVIVFQSEISDMASKLSLKKEKDLLDAESLVKSNVEKCIKSVLMDALHVLSYQGGRLYPLKNQETSFFYSYEVEVYQKGGLVGFPKLSQIEDEIPFYLNFHVPRCVDASGLKLIYKTPKSSVKVLKDTVDVTFNWDVFYGENNSRKIEKFIVRESIAFQSAYNDAKLAYRSFTSGQKDIFDVLMEGKSKNYSIAIETQKGITFYVMQFNNVKLDNETLKFIIAIKPGGAK